MSGWPNNGDCERILEEMGHHLNEVTLKNLPGETGEFMTHSKADRYFLSRYSNLTVPEFS